MHSSRPGKIGQMYGSENTGGKSVSEMVKWGRCDAFYTASALEDKCLSNSFGKEGQRA